MTDTAKTAYLFPGQGSQSVGMGKDLYETYPTARALFDQADEALGFSFRSSASRDLNQTLTSPSTPTRPRHRGVYLLHAR
jgi:malonyl CoA-acyl carrier protein transacylase